MLSGRSIGCATSKTDARRTMTDTDKLKSQNTPESRNTIVLVGLMGAGKTCIGRRLAERLGCPFVDADEEIEKAAGCSIPDIFELYGESAFRDGERRVIARLLSDPPHVLATGGGAFIDEEVRRKIAESAISVWLRADLDLLLQRTSRRGDRPLLSQGNRRVTLERLMEERYPVYAEAEITIDSTREVPEITVERVLKALEARVQPATELHGNAAL
jgi:shikimate kinase